MITVVLIGSGSIANLAHLPALVHLRDEHVLDIAGVCDTNEAIAKAAAAKFGIPRSGSNWKRLAQECGADAVSICVPPGPNVPLAVEAIDQGLHVICEKPPARTAAQAERMAAAALRRPDLVTMVAFNRRYAPLYTRAMEQSLRLGTPHAFHGRFMRPALGSEPSNTADDWITSDGAHVLDLALATLGYPERIMVARHRSGAGPDNVWTLELSGAVGASVIVFDFAAGRRLERFEWSGPGYDVVLELPQRAEWSQRGADAEVWNAATLTGTDDFFRNYGFIDEYRRFADAIEERGPRPPTSFEYGWSFMALTEAILACRSGECRDIATPAREPARRAEMNGAGAWASGLASAPESGGSASRFAASPSRHDADGSDDRPVVRILQSGSAQQRYFRGAALARVAERCEVRWREDDARGRPTIEDADAIITGWGGTALTREDLERAARLRLMVVIGASVKGVTPEYLLERGVTICNTADAIAASVGEHCLLLTLAGLRRITEVDREMHRHGWPPDTQSPFSIKALRRRAERVPGLRAAKPVLRPVAQWLMARGNGRSGKSTTWNDLRGQVVGLVGWGHTARHFATLLEPFGCELLVCSDSATVEELARYGARRVALGEAIGAAKVVSLHKGLTDRTRGLIGAAELALLQPGAVLVNTARGALIDEQALIERLRRGDVVAALDVYHEEPLPRAHALRRLRNVILTPHNASSTPECQRRVGAQALEILSDWLSGNAVRGLETRQLVAMT